MRTLLNIIWHFPFFGFLSALWYAIWGAIFCCTVILFPIGLGYFNFAHFLLSPFSSAMVSRSDLAKLTGKKQNTAVATYNTIIRILYFPFGLINAIFAILLIVLECISIIGIPCGLVWAKGLSTIFNPVNKVRVPKVVADEIERLKSQGQLESYMGKSAGNLSPEVAQYVETASQEEEKEKIPFDKERIKSGLRCAPKWMIVAVVALLFVPTLVFLLQFVVPQIAILFVVLGLVMLERLLCIGAGIFLLIKYHNDNALKIAGIVLIVATVITIPVISNLFNIAAALCVIGEYYGTKESSAPSFTIDNTDH